MKTFLTFLLVAMWLFSFSQSSGSLYTAFGLGEIRSSTTGHQEGLGGTGIGLRASLFYNDANPAANIAMQKPTTMHLDIGAYVDATYARNEQENNLQKGGGLSNITLWMQPNRHWGTTLGLSPFSSIKYNIQANRFNETLNTDYSITYTGSGGLNNFFWSNAFLPFKNFSAGATIQVLFGAIDRTEDFTATSTINSFSTISKTNLLGVQVKTGLQYSFHLRGNQITLGTTYAMPANLSALTQSMLRNNTGDELEKQEETPSYRLPLQVGIGASWQTKRWLLASDFSLQQWSNARMNTNYELNDTWKWSVGMEWTPNDPSYLFLQQTFALQSGFFIQNYHQKVNGNNFPVWGFSVGASIPVSRKLHHLNIGYTYRQQGTQNDNLLLESIHKLSFSTTFRDIWFLKPKFN